CKLIQRSEEGKGLLERRLLSRAEVTQLKILTKKLTISDELFIPPYTAGLIMPFLRPLLMAK
ncbi:hypothetical protein, partial [Shewanella sp.]|uniref:hypothetical protein n=1 Tax=Shewanella sp. TaxID=50422 RepID=UPI0040474A1C